jgi:hypothetical protein
MKRRAASTASTPKKRCPQCKGTLPPPTTGRPRRFCCDRCRREWNNASSILRNEAEWLRDRAEDSRLNAQRFTSSAPGWLRSARELDAQADEIDRLLEARRG